MELATVAPAFIEMAHRIVWCTAATVDSSGKPRTRILHPIWEWDGEHLTGYIATDPTSLKARHLDTVPFVSLTYWSPNQDTCSAECATEWTNDLESKRVGWDRFLNGPVPVGYDPGIIPVWPNPESEQFGILRLTPTRLRVMDGSLMAGGGEGQLLIWTA
jgi:hypothetical protein